MLAKRAHCAFLEEANVLEADDTGELIVEADELAARYEQATTAAALLVTREQVDKGVECTTALCV